MFFFPFADENPTKNKPLISWSIILVCSIIFLNYVFEQDYAKEIIFLSFGMIPALIFGYYELSDSLNIVPPTFTIITSMFLHGGWMHLIGNMTYLYIFGDNIEETLGKIKFIIFYLLTGGCAALAQALLDPSSTIPMVGASGAIAGILGGYLVLFPRAKIKVFFWFIIFFKIIKIRAYIVLGGWILIQFLSFNGNDLNSGGIAYAAHIGGFISGIILIYILKNKKEIRHKISKGSVPNSR